MISQIISDDVKYIAGRQLPWERFSGKTILITGATGFIARYIVETLLHLNEYLDIPCTVIGVVRSRDKAEKHLFHHKNNHYLKIICQDITNPLNIEGPVDFIFHAASQASPRLYFTDPVGTISANVNGTWNLLELAKRKKSQGFIFFSSGEVYGETKADSVSETDYGYLDPISVRSCYAESKRIGETMCVAWAHQHAIPTYILRIFHTYGPGIDLNDGRVFADFIADILYGRDIIIKSDGMAQRPFCYISDAVEGFMTVLLKGEIATPYNIGNDKAEISIKGLAETLVKLFPEKGLSVIMAPEKQSASYAKSPVLRNCPDTSRIRKIGWAPRISIEEGFRRTVLSFPHPLSQ